MGGGGPLLIEAIAPRLNGSLPDGRGHPAPVLPAVGTAAVPALFRYGRDFGENSVTFLRRNVRKSEITEFRGVDQPGFLPNAVQPAAGRRGIGHLWGKKLPQQGELPTVMGTQNYGGVAVQGFGQLRRRAGRRSGMDKGSGRSIGGRAGP